MALNKSKCGIMFLGGKNQLTVKETETGFIEELPLIDSYKYLGVYLNKTLTPSNHLKYLSNKTNKFKKLMNILNYQNCSGKILLTLWKVFPAAILSYAGFINLAELSDQSHFKQFDLLYKKSIKSTFRIQKNTPYDIITRQLLIPNARHNLLIQLNQVTRKLLLHYTRISEQVKMRLSGFQDLI